MEPASAKRASTHAVDQQTRTSADDGLVELNRQRFERLLSRAARHAARERYELAAPWAEMAADQACNAHPGFFVDDRLESVLVRIGSALPAASRSPARVVSDWPRRVLHVLTEARSIGGHTRFVWRWIEADRDRRHCVALTRQRLPGALPPALLAASTATGGWVRELDWCRLRPVARAAQLQTLAMEFDLVVLHTHPFDVVPAIAFAAGGPPVVLLNHAGFSFWVGRDVADVVACLRPSSRDLAVQRRGLEADRCPQLPIPVSPPEHAISRAEARKMLDLPADAVVLFTVANPFKYVAFDPGPSFLKVVTDLAQTHERIHVRAIGPEDQGLWRKAREQTDGRVRALGSHPAVGLHERAADLYLDSFPVTSPTSFLEAGSYGLPIVSICPHRDRAAVLCADDFTLDDRLIRTTTTDSLAAEVARLIDDEAARLALGSATAAAVMAGHGREAFMLRLTEVYARAAAAHEAGRSAGGNRGRAGQLDTCLARMQLAAGLTPSFRVLARRHLDALPYVPRPLVRLKACLGSYIARRQTTAASLARRSDGVGHGSLK